jgi:hypothetical protein
MLPLDPGLNTAILSIASDLFPDGFDVSPDAPSTYKALKAHLDTGKRLVVYDGGCEGTIYVDPALSSICSVGIFSTRTATPPTPGTGLTFSRLR